MLNSIKEFSLICVVIFLSLYSPLKYSIPTFLAVLNPPFSLSNSINLLSFKVYSFAILSEFSSVLPSFTSMISKLI